MNGFQTSLFSLFGYRDVLKMQNVLPIKDRTVNYMSGSHVCFYCSNPIDKSIKNTHSSKSEARFQLNLHKGIEMERIILKPKNKIINKYSLKYFSLNLIVLVSIVLLIHFLIQQTHFAVLGLLIGSIFLLGFGCISLLSKVRGSNKPPQHN